MTVFTSDVLAAVGCDRTDYNNWRKRAFAPTWDRLPELSDAREPMTKFAAYLVGFMNALVSVGFTPAEAAARAQIYAAKWPANLVGKWLIYFPDDDLQINCGDIGAEKSILDAFETHGDHTIHGWDATFDFDEPKKRQHLAARVVNLGEIAARVEALFA